MDYRRNGRSDELIMSIKYFCDCCEQEITAENKVNKGLESSSDTRLSGLYTRRNNMPSLMFEVITGKTNTWNDGNWCKYCIIAAVNSLDNRSRAA